MQIDLERLASDPERGNPSQRFGVWRKLDRVFNILRYYRTSQLSYRVWKTVRGRIQPPRYHLDAAPTGVQVHPAAVHGLTRIAMIRGPHRALDVSAAGTDLKNGVFTLLNDRQELGVAAGQVQWARAVEKGLPHLWRFHLHYHEYLLDLMRCEDTPEVDHAATTVEWCVGSWLDEHPVDTARPGLDAWHPYCISRRLPVWLLLLGLDAGRALTGDGGWSAAFRKRLIESCYVHAHFLVQHLEYDLGGNHLLENVTALAMGALVLDEATLPNAEEPRQWVEVATRVLEHELPQQILPHGEHFERTPTYHCQLLGNLLFVAALCEARGLYPRLAEVCRETAQRMWIFLAATVHPDGEIPLFADSAQGEAWTVRELRELVALVGLSVGSEPADGCHAVGPYWMARHDGDVLILDAGQAMADCLPAHGHCDMLGMEASIGGRRWFVDSGLFNYEDDSMREYCRSSLAHNVTMIDDRDQCDVWSKFRMGFRGSVSNVATGTDANGVEWVRASHNGYRRLGVTAVYRTMQARCGEWTCIDRAEGNRQWRFTGRLHLMPGIDLERRSAESLVLGDGEQQRVLTFSTGLDIEIVEGWYCPAFGRRMRTQVIAYSLPGNGGEQEMRWTLTRGDSSSQ